MLRAVGAFYSPEHRRDPFPPCLPSPWRLARAPTCLRVRPEMNVLVTGGCGFIGSNLVKYVRKQRPGWKVVTFDKLTYAGNLENLKELEGDQQHVFVKGDVGN